MRRTLIILAFGLGGLLDGAAAGAAHVCAMPAEVAVGERVTLTVGVGAERSPVTAVEIEVPDGFTLTDASSEGWTVEQRDGVVRFSGSSIAAFACGYVTLRGVAEERARLVFPLVMETEGGDRRRYDSVDAFQEDSALLVYAGMPIPVQLDAGAGDRSPIEIAGWVLVGAGALLAAGLGVTRWRRRGGQNRSP